MVLQSNVALEKIHLVLRLYPYNQIRVMPAMGKMRFSLDDYLHTLFIIVISWVGSLFCLLYLSSFGFIFCSLLELCSRDRQDAGTARTRSAGYRSDGLRTEEVAR